MTPLLSGIPVYERNSHVNDADEFGGHQERTSKLFANRIRTTWTTRDCCLPRCVTRALLLEVLDHAFEIGIAGAKLPCKPVPTALRNLLAVRDHLELTSLARRNDSFNA
jgi:hypothetical protein